MRLKIHLRRGGVKAAQTPLIRSKHICGGFIGLTMQLKGPDKASSYPTRATHTTIRFWSSLIGGGWGAGIEGWVRRPTLETFGCHSRH